MKNRPHLYYDLLDQEMAKAVKIAYNKCDLQTLSNFIEISFDIMSNTSRIPDIAIIHQAILDNAVEIVDFLLRISILEFHRTPLKKKVNQMLLNYRSQWQINW